MIDQNLPRTCLPVPTDVGVAGPRVFVFGSARSGTTLLLNLFRTFNGVTVLDREHCSTSLLTSREPGWLVVKRTPNCADHLMADLPALHGIWIVDIMRDPRDVVTSRLAPWPDYYCDFARWERDIRAVAAIRGRHIRLLHLRYEELVVRGDWIQSELADVLGLRVAAPFSAFPSVMPGNLAEESLSALGGLRSLSPDRIGRWRRDPADRNRVRDQLRAHPALEPLLRHAGYQATEELLP